MKGEPAEERFLIAPFQVGLQASGRTLAGRAAEADARSRRLATAADPVGDPERAGADAGRLSVRPAAGQADHPVRPGRRTARPRPARAAARDRAARARSASPLRAFNEMQERLAPLRRGPHRHGRRDRARPAHAADPAPVPRRVRAAETCAAEDGRRHRRDGGDDLRHAGLRARRRRARPSARGWSSPRCWRAWSTR